MVVWISGSWMLNVATLPLPKLPEVRLMAVLEIVPVTEMGCVPGEQVEDGLRYWKTPETFDPWMVSEPAK